MEKPTTHEGGIQRDVDSEPDLSEMSLTSTHNPLNTHEPVRDLTAARKVKRDHAKEVRVEVDDSGGVKLFDLHFGPIANYLFPLNQKTRNGLRKNGKGYSKYWWRVCKYYSSGTCP
ncbi:hypothetical protein B0T14DRAFT_567856 [Immersiella caudata]|uniref:Uncharacterized protein n=1 Tax=Immersiella caudata TaxID=314043 RepID=A0AA39WIW3_9PEZI|nr:hypothetical protein B0T14DRAFT_567856 [Immersiella caudata]